MKAISLWQPWATLIALGAKEYETRSWDTNYRGSIIIHAAKRESELREIWLQIQKAHELKTPLPHGSFAWHFTNVMLEEKRTTGKAPKYSDIPLGAAIAVAQLVDCIPTTNEWLRRITPEERAFGNFAPGRFAWHLRNVRIFKTPIPVRGAQGLFECNLDPDSIP